MENDVFYEEQRFTQAWVQVILYLLWGSLCAIAIALLITRKRGPVPAMSLLVLTSLFILFFRSLKLQVKLGDHSIAYRFFPVQWRYKIIDMSQIETLKVIDYDPLPDYGGWGIRYGKKGAAYTVKGNHGLYIRQVDQRTVLIGTSRPKEMEGFLQTHELSMKALRHNI